MSRILAMLDDSAVAATVLATATTIARLTNASVDAVTVVPDDEAHRSTTGGSPVEARVVVGDPVETLTAELSADDVTFGVLGSRALDDKTEAVGHVAEALIARTTVPLVVVGPRGRALGDGELVFLLPLDGAAASTAAVHSLALELARAGHRAVTLHVFDSADHPPPVESPYDLDVVAREFLATHTADCSDRVELRLGDAGTEILDVADSERADAIVVSWAGDLAAGHAAVIKKLLRDARVPVVLHRSAAPGDSG